MFTKMFLVDPEEKKRKMKTRMRKMMKREKISSPHYLVLNQLYEQ